MENKPYIPLGDWRGILALSLVLSYIVTIVLVALTVDEPSRTEILKTSVVSLGSGLFLVLGFYFGKRQ